MMDFSFVKRGILITVISMYVENIMCSSQVLSETDSRNEDVDLLCLYEQPCGEPIGCRCDDNCLIYGDCCKDKFDSFNETQLSGIKVSTATCIDISSVPYYIIQTCSLSWPDDRVRDLCEQVDNAHDIFKNLPVYDTDGNHYKNVFCASCNKIQIDDMTAWLVIQPETALSYIAEAEINLWYSVPSDLAEYLQPRRCIDMGIANCDYVNLGELGKKCPGYYAPVNDVNSYSPTVYKNPECAVCNGFELDDIKDCSSGSGDVDYSASMSLGNSYEAPDIAPAEDFPDFRPLTVLFATSYFDIQTVEIDNLCKDGQVFDPFKKVCIVLYCSDGYKLVDNQCILSICSIWLLQFNVITKENRDIKDNNSALTCLLQNLQNGVSNVFPLQASYSEFNDQFQIQFEIRVNIDYLDLSNYLSDLFHPNTEENQSNYMPCNVTSLTVDQFCEYSINLENCSTDGIDVDGNVFPKNTINHTMIYINESQSFFSPYVSLFRHQYIQDGNGYNSTTQLFLCSQNTVFSLTCPFILDEIHNYVIVNGSLEHIKSGKVYGPNSYELTDNQTVKICSTFKQRGTSVNYFVLYNVSQTLLSVIGCILSLVALVLTFLVYCLLSPLRTLPGKSVMSLTVALFCAQFLLTFGAGRTKITAACKVIAITMHFFWLASFVWMTVLAYDISKTFKSKACDRSKGDKRKTFMKYSTVAWGSSFVIVAICVTLSMTVESLDFGYGTASVCWISDPVISLVIFGGPVAFTLFLNAIYFGLTVHGVRETMKSSKILQRNTSKLKSTRSELKIYFKISSIMGFSWIFGFIANFTGIGFLWYIFIVLCTLQGVFIFVSFVCNARVYGLLKERYQAHRPSSKNITMTKMSTEK
ncbi:uncharacterized protein LOC117118153 [Anneissia japonica]|uniref:uncharacterized protein LOC117118153 n=1 Tax=Anneissia japonica TaxID=1529436 RepID=UPI0014255618|nr:uncharacterized protein LOC117118153 [Anneissia japonica]